MTFYNAQRNLRIAQTEFRYLSEGAYGVVFVDDTHNLIRKVYRRRSDAMIAHCQQVFQAEVEAYEIASKVKELVPLVPTYFGLKGGQIIIDRDGKDVTGEFYPDLAFEAEFVNCPFQKISAAAHDEYERVVNLFRQHSINHMNDSSVCLKDGKIVKVIDFAIKDVELAW